VCMWCGCERSYAPEEDACLSWRVFSISTMRDRKIRKTMCELKVTTRLKERDERGRMIPRVVMLNLLTLQPYFAYPLHVASEKLGLCTTSLER
jgi:hypothetical protein